VPGESRDVLGAADAIRAAFRGRNHLLVECTEEEEAGFMLIADAIHALQFIRAANSETK
jgi:hypothetical protein